MVVKCCDDFMSLVWKMEFGETFRCETCGGEVEYSRDKNVLTVRRKDGIKPEDLSSTSR